MRHEKSLLKTFRAVLLLAGGMALLFGMPGCESRPMLKKEPAVEKKAPEVPDAFAQAARYDSLGEYERAYSAYERYAAQNPSGEKTLQALTRMAFIRYGDRRFQEALSLFERIAAEYAGSPEARQAVLYILACRFHLGDFENVLAMGDEWLARNPGDPLEGDILFLLGRSSQEAGEPVQGFFYLIRAARHLALDEKKLEELDKAVNALIRSSGLEQLQVLAEQKKGNPYLNGILYRIAELHLDRSELLQAQEAAFQLLEATSDPDWVLKARQVLAAVDEKLAVRKGRIGCLLPLSGPYSIYGQEVLNGIQLGAAPWLDNVRGPEVELIIRDTRGEVEETLKGLEELVRDGQVMAVVGPLSSKTAKAAAARAQEMGVPIIAMAQADDLPLMGDMVFRNFLTPSMEVDAVVDEAVHGMGFRHFGILYPDNPYGRYFMNLFWDRLEELGCEVRAVESYAPDKTDFSREVEKMVGLHYSRPESVTRLLEEMKARQGGAGEEKDSEEDEPEPFVDFDAVFIPDNSERVALIAPQFPFHKVLGVPLLGTSLWQTENLIKQAGDYIQDAVVPSGFFEDADSEAVRAFAALYRENFENSPGLLSATGYDTILLLKTILGDSSILTRNDLQRALLDFEGLEGVTGRLSFDASGEIQKAPLILKVKGRRFVPVTTPDSLQLSFPPS